jgi:hypothetical protein
MAHWIEETALVIIDEADGGYTIILQQKLHMVLTRSCKYFTHFINGLNVVDGPATDEGIDNDEDDDYNVDGPFT